MPACPSGCGIWPTSTASVTSPCGRSGRDRTAGIAHFMALPGEPGTAEVAVMVADRFQNRGIGGLQHWLLEEESRS